MCYFDYCERAGEGIMTMMMRQGGGSSFDHRKSPDFPV